MKTVAARTQALDLLRRFRALRCGDSFVVDDRGHEVVTLSADARGITYAHAVDERYARVADAISDADIPFSEVRCSGEVVLGPELTGEFDVAAVPQGGRS